MFRIPLRKEVSVCCLLGVLVTCWLPSSANPLLVKNASFPVQALKGVSYPFGIDIVVGWTGLPSSDLVFYTVTDVAAGTTAGLQNISAFEEEDGTLISSLAVEGVATGTGDRTFRVDIMTESDFSDAVSVEAKVFIIPPILSILPPVMIIFVAVLSKSVLLSLSIGVYTACFITYKFNIFQAFLHFWDVYIIGAASKPDNVAIMCLNFFLSGMVGVILKNGGGFGAAKAMCKFAKNRRNAALATFLLGLMIMFHSYANALIVGQSMRPVTDMFLISREKLAFLVDSTSAPIASLSPISSWIGYELSLIRNVLDSLIANNEDISCYDASPFIIFCKTIPRRYYPLGVLMIQCVCILVSREFGPMLAAERRAVCGGGVAPPASDENLADLGKTIDDRLNPHPEVPLKWWHAFVPVILVIFFTVFFLCYTGAQNAKAVGLEASLHSWFGESDSNMSIVYASFLSSMTAFLMSRLLGYTSDGKVFPTVFTRYFTKEKVRPFLFFSESCWAWIEGMKDLLQAMLILCLAWAVGLSFLACNTGTFVSSAASQNIKGQAFPALSFCIAAILSGITGTSWGTMAIMFPLVLPASHFAAPCNKNIFYGTIASILSGAIFGDHISPLSDTTIISCIATRCDIWQHVITQAPYAFMAGSVSMIFGDIAVGYGWYMYEVGIILVLFDCTTTVYLICVPVNGDKVDIFTMAYRKLNKMEENPKDTFGLADHSIANQFSEDELLESGTGHSRNEKSSNTDDEDSK